MIQFGFREVFWTFFVFILFAISPAHGQQTESTEIPPSVLEELTPKPELGHRLLEELSEEGVHVPLAPYYSVSTPASSVNSGRDSLQDVALDAVSQHRPSLGDG